MARHCEARRVGRGDFGNPHFILRSRLSSRTGTCGRLLIWEGRGPGHGYTAAVLVVWYTSVLVRLAVPDVVILSLSPPFLPSPSVKEGWELVEVFQSLGLYFRFWSLKEVRS